MWDDALLYWPLFTTSLEEIRAGHMAGSLTHPLRHFRTGCTENCYNSPLERGEGILSVYFQGFVYLPVVKTCPMKNTAPPSPFVVVSSDVSGNLEADMILHSVVWHFIWIWKLWEEIELFEPTQNHCGGSWR